jgi:hypothetical protein
VRSASRRCEGGRAGVNSRVLGCRQGFRGPTRALLDAWEERYDGDDEDMERIAVGRAATSKRREVSQSWFGGAGAGWRETFS